MKSIKKKVKLNIISSLKIMIMVMMQVLEQEMTRSVAKYREENRLTKQFWDWIQVLHAFAVQKFSCFSFISFSFPLFLFENIP